MATLGACECDCGGVGSETIGSRHSINEKDPLLLPLESAGSAVLDDSPDLITQTVAQAGRSQLEMLPFEVLGKKFFLVSKSCLRITQAITCL